MAVQKFFDYMREQMEAIATHKYFLSQKAGRDVGLNAAIEDWIETGLAAKFARDYTASHNITALDADVKQTLNGDSCLIFELRAVAHNHENGKEAVLEQARVAYCFGNRTDCPNRTTDEKGALVCNRISKNN